MFLSPVHLKRCCTILPDIQDSGANYKERSVAKAWFPIIVAWSVFQGANCYFTGKLMLWCHVIAGRRGHWVLTMLFALCALYFFIIMTLSTRQSWPKQCSVSFSFHPGPLSIGVWLHWVGLKTLTPLHLNVSLIPPIHWVCNSTVRDLLGWAAGL